MIKILKKFRVDGKDKLNKNKILKKECSGMSMN